MDQPEGTTFAEQLKRFRKRVRLSQQILAERIGAHRSTVSFWERGEHVPETLTTVLELARVLHLSEADKRLLIEARFGTASILPLYNVPEPNPYFTGREALLEALHRALTAGEQVALVQPQAISGLGGVGKTQLALVYAYRYRASYHDILWALAESRETLVASYVTFAEQLRLDCAASQEQQRVVEAVKRWLRDHKGWLLILDNVEDLALVRAFVPAPRQGALLLTTRRHETSPLARALPLDVLPVEEGVLFLLRRAGLLPLEAGLAVASAVQRETARAIVAAVGALPLALDQAGAYLAETRCRLEDYLVLLRQEQATLLARRGSVLSEHPESVTTTFALALAQVEQRSAAASDLLKLCAYLAPEAIPLDLFSPGGDELGPVLGSVVAEMLAVDAALETLQAYSLVRRDPEQGTLSLHRLVQAVQQTTLSADEQRLWAERAVGLLCAAFPAPGPSTWERCQQLLPHALLCSEHIRHWGLAFPNAASLLYHTGHYLYQRAMYEQALSVLNQALAMREQVLGHTHPDVAQTLDILAALSYEQGHYPEAVPFAERALAVREQALGSRHPDVAESLNTLGMLYHVQGHYTQALPLLQRALALREQGLGRAHPDVAQSLNNLALIHYDRGQYEQALPLYQQALAMWEQTLGPDHPEVATSLNNLAALYRAQGQYEQALPLYQRSLAIREQMLGSAHPDVAWSLNGLARLYRAQNQEAEALPLIQRALAIAEQALGPVHPEVAVSLDNLAELYCARSQEAEALPLVQRALAIREQALGPDHPDVATSLHALARLYEDRGQVAEAVPLLERALAILERTLPDHPDTAATEERLAALVQRIGRAKAADPAGPEPAAGAPEAPLERELA